ncbi:lamin tail domain-containing protein [Aureibaculum algae]|uniref:Lamin tail domain-containing protein n=2 Tax=Aureibaculum algae TaxID=2584122 RepID=A0A5B7TXP0_9FLAO|nr:lamin tail domain-containing protein [Aureibaculum algae]
MSGIDENNMSDRNAFIQDESGAIALRMSSASSLRSGYQVKINLKDAVLGSLRGLLQANIVQYKQVLFVADNVALPDPNTITIEELNTGNYEAQLVSIDNVQFEEEEGTYKGNIPLTDCKKTVVVLTISTATFANEEYQKGNGKIIGIASTYTDPVLLLKNLEGTVNMTGSRCVPTGDITNKVFISEIADPDNNTNARFIEIYNADSKPIDLTAWTLNRYTNESNTVSSSMDLSGITLEVGQAFVIAVNDVEFEAVFGFAPDMDGISTGPAGSNGDDNITLVDPNGTIIDIFGRIGEDGSGTNHEFEDGRALRNPSITQGNPVYTFSEWQLWNDTGAEGTTKLPQTAPGDFTPGVR